MLNQRRDWCRSVIAALLTVTTCAAALAQGQGRLSNRGTEFGDVNRLIRDGVDSSTAPGTSRRGSSFSTQVDLSGVDQRVVQNLLKECVIEAERLYQSLRADYRRAPEIRPLLSELISMRARVSRLAQDMDSNISLERLLPAFQQLDSDWQLLAHHLNQSRAISNASRDSVSRLTRIERELEKMFKMEPQLDRRALQVELSSLTSSIRNLVQELELDTGGGNRIYELILDTRKLGQQVYRVQDMVLDQYTYADVVAEYNRFGRMWDAVSPELRQLNNRYVERSMRNIMMADNRMHDLLWLEQQTNRENLRQISKDLMQDVEEFFSRVPLKLLLRFKDVNRILETADDFYGVVQNFQDCVERDEDPSTMLECYRYVEEYGVDFVRAFEPLRSQAGRIVLREIEDGIVAIRNELNLSGTVTSIDTRAMIPTAANLENLADHLDFDVKQWLNRERPTYRGAALEASRRFVQRSQRIHRMLQSRPTASQLKSEISDLAEEFRAIYQYLGRCNTEHRSHLRVLSQDISRTIYDLRAPLQL